MARQRRSFSSGFKKGAARLVLDKSASFVEASCSLDVGTNTLARWAKQLDQEHSGITLSSKAFIPEPQQISSFTSRRKA